jgi:hypothetical protein
VSCCATKKSWAKRILACFFAVVILESAHADSCLFVRAPGESEAQASARYESMRLKTVTNEQVARGWKNSGEKVFVGRLEPQNRWKYAMAMFSSSFWKGLKALLFGSNEEHMVVSAGFHTVVFVAANGWQTDCSFEERLKRQEHGKRYAFLLAALSGSDDSSYRMGVASASALVSDGF